ncbi:hypothetical protein [Larkinella soli]|uniref:hypothetical protein n=1 Tax=Larkinella soli TaxID=1770527 RepID=UPI000FFB4596|nr:hypothetical protein [Larkinella soli]
MEYLILILGFLGAAIGIFGKSWDKDRKNLTAIGWLSFIVAFAALVFTFINTINRNRALDDRKAMVKNITNEKIINGLNYITEHLTNQENLNDSILKLLTEDTLYLARHIGVIPLINSPLITIENTNDVEGRFDYPYQKISSNIKEGKKQLQDLLDNNLNDLEIDKSNLINSILNDKYFKDTYSLLGLHQSLILSSISNVEERPSKYMDYNSYPAWSYLGTHYFSLAPYIRNDTIPPYDLNMGPGNFKDFQVFVGKIRTLFNKCNNELKG